MPAWIMLVTPKSGIYHNLFLSPLKYYSSFENEKARQLLWHYNTIYAYVEDYHTCSGIFNEPVNAGMATTLGRFNMWHLWHLFPSSLKIFKILC